MSAKGVSPSDPLRSGPSPSDPQSAEPSRVLAPARLLVRYPQAVLSHESAARALGIELVDAGHAGALSVPRTHGHVQPAGWRVHRVALPASDVMTLDDGLRTTTPARTVGDLARLLELGPAVAAADSALRQGMVGIQPLSERLWSQRGTSSARCRAVADRLDPRAGSVLESLLRILLHEADFPAPLTQHHIWADGQHLATVDFCWPAYRLVVEADGFAFHSERGAYRRDRERQNALMSLGWSVLRFTWEDVLHRPGYVVALISSTVALAA